MGIRRAAGLTWNRLLMRVDNSAGKGTSGMDNFGSVIDRMNMKLGSKFLNPLRTKTQLLKRLQCVIVVDGATHTQRMVWRVTEAPWRIYRAEDFVLFLHGTQLVLRSSVLTVLDRDEVYVTLKNAEIFVSAVWRRWICWWRLAVLFDCSRSPSVLPPCNS